MMVNPWARAIAAIPGRPTPSPITAAAPAPMNTNEKGPMNSTRSFGAIRLDIIDSRGEIDRAALRFAPGNNALVWDGRRRGGVPSADEASPLLSGDRLRSEIDAQRVCDTGAVRGIGLVAVDNLPLDDLDRHAFHRSLVVMKKLLPLVGGHQPEQVARLTIVVVAVPVAVAIGIARDFQRRLAEALVLYGAVERVRLRIGIRIRIACEPHGTIGVISVHRAARLVDGKLIRIDADAVAVRIGVGKDAG